MAKRSKKIVIKNNYRNSSNVKFLGGMNIFSTILEEEEEKEEIVVIFLLN